MCNFTSDLIIENIVTNILIDFILFYHKKRDLYKCTIEDRASLSILEFFKLNFFSSLIFPSNAMKNANVMNLLLAAKLFKKS